VAVLTQHDFKDDLVTVTLNAIDDAKSVLMPDVSAVAQKCDHEVMLSYLGQFGVTALSLLRFLDRVDPTEG